MNISLAFSPRFDGRSGEGSSELIVVATPTRMVYHLGMFGGDFISDGPTRFGHRVALVWGCVGLLLTVQPAWSQPAFEEAQPAAVQPEASPAEPETVPVSPEAEQPVSAEAAAGDSRQGAAPAQSGALTDDIGTSVLDDTGPRDIREIDGHADRLILFPAADTHPEGTLYFTAYQLIFWQLGYAFTNEFQASITTWPIIVEEQPLFIDATLKYRFLETEHIRVAALAGMLGVGTDGDWVGSPRFGLTGQYCFEMGCHVSLHLGGLGTTLFNDGVDAGLLLIGAAGLRAKLSEVFSLLLEAEVGSLTEADGTDLADGALINYGVRLSGEAFALDIAFLRPTVDSPFVLGLPWVSATYRGIP